MSLTVMRCDYGSAFPACSTVGMLSLFVWIGRSTVRQPMEESSGL